MIKLFRMSLVVAVIAVLAAFVMPFDRPLEISFSIERPPVMLLVTAACMLLTLSLLPVAAYGLIRFRRWARVVAALAAIPLFGLLLVMGSGTGIGSVVPVSTKVVAAIACISWLLAVLLSCASDVRQRFLSP